jgi:hypothetical protein
MMKNKRVVDFRKRKNKLKIISPEQDGKMMERMVGLILGLSKRLMDLEKEVKDMKVMLPIAKAADYRSLAVQRLLESKGISNKEEMIKITNEILIEDFDLKSAQDDVTQGLEIVTDRLTQKDDHVIINMKFYKDGKELVEEEYPKTKITIGSYEMFPELDDALISMKIGECKKFPVNLINETDECVVTLIGIRQKRIIPDEASKKEDHQNVRDSDKG